MDDLEQRAGRDGVAALSERQRCHLERHLAAVRLEGMKPRERRAFLRRLLAHCDVSGDERTGRVVVSATWSLEGFAASLFLSVIPPNELTLLAEEALAVQGICPLGDFYWKVAIVEPRKQSSGGVH